MLSAITPVRMCMLLLLFFVANIINAQAWQKTDAGIEAVLNEIKIEISFYSPSIVRILKSPKGHSFSKESLSVIKKPQKTTFKVKQQGDVLNLTSEKCGLALILNQEQWRIMRKQEIFF